MSIHVKPSSTSPSQPSPSPCPESDNGQELLQALYKGTITSIHDNGRELHIGIPGNWAAFSLEDQTTTIHQIRCYAQELNRPLRYTHLPTPPQGRKALPEQR